ncbi:MAG: hypothetical protein M1830_001531 [Pleopsidium flavum]|nr:MAG: hypothetical protein M1830_001531 [Pleopsidium flavum]
MDRDSSSRRIKAQYLIFYNFISAVLWLAVLGRVVLLVPLVGFKNVYGGVGEFAKWTQTLALLELAHSASDCTGRISEKSVIDHGDASRLKIATDVGNREQLPRYDELVTSILDYVGRMERYRGDTL